MSDNGTATAARLHERLNDPATVENLNRLLDHLDLIAFTVESTAGFLRRGDEIAESVADGVREMRGWEGLSPTASEALRKAPKMLETGMRLADAASHIDADELQRSKVLERLTDPETLDAVNRVLDRLPLAVFLLESLEGFIERGDTIAENVNDAVQELRDGGQTAATSHVHQLIRSLPKLREAADRFLESELMGEGLGKVIDAGIAMIDAGMLDHRVVQILGKLGRQAIEAYQDVASRPVEPIGGMWALMRATKDPDVQKTLGFLFAFLKRFAKNIN